MSPEMSKSHPAMCEHWDPKGKSLYFLLTLFASPFYLLFLLNTFPFLLLLCNKDQMMLFILVYKKTTVRSFSPILYSQHQHVKAFISNCAYSEESKKQRTQTKDVKQDLRLSIFIVKKKIRCSVLECTDIGERSSTGNTVHAKPYEAGLLV